MLAIVLGYVLEWAFYSYLYERDHLQQVLMTYGLILEEGRSLLVGDDVHGVKPPDILAGLLPLGDLMTYPVYRLFISGVCIALAIGMYLVFMRTRLGMMIRAGSTNREMVRAWASTSSSCTASCSPPAWRSPPSPAWWPRR